MRLSAATRRNMPKSDFAGPSKSFPVNDKTHAREAIDQFYAAFEAAFYANGSTIPGATITETIQEVDGSVSTFKYTGVQVVPSKTGDWRGDDKVSQVLDVVASQRVQVN